MGEENLQNPDEEATPQITAEGYEIIFDKGTNEITLKDPTGKTATLKATVIEPEEDEEEAEPMTVEEFREALKKIDELGLTWTADAIPEVKPKNEESEGALLSDEFEEIQKRYPNLPEELAAVIAYELTRNQAFVSEAGGLDTLKQKLAIIRELQIVTADFRSEFFFKHSIKVPYFANVDWEIVFKLEEKNVHIMPNAGYALLNLVFHDPNVERGEGNRHPAMTVAANLAIVERLIKTLSRVKEGLERSRNLARLMDEKYKSEGEGDAESEAAELEEGGGAETAN